jgi:Uma2 family endonuclease
VATATRHLTLGEFRAQYQGRKPYFEYWFGEPIQKSMPTWLHSVLQGILVELLKRAGYKSGSELELRIDPNWQPVPDVTGVSTSPAGPYPTQPVDIVIEILSPDDPFPQVLKKCRHYARIGTQKIFIADPEEKTAWEWNEGAQRLERVDALQLPNGQSMPLSDVWTELDKQR